jgi:AcrR family transcriptional regulator
MRRAILDAARRLFIEGGYANVPVRRVATEVRCSPAALYRYFRTKDEVFVALAEEGLTLLVRDAMRAEGASPMDRLRQFFWGVYEFAAVYPEYYYLIFLDRSAPRLRADSRALRTLLESVDVIDEVLKACVAAGELKPGLHPMAVHQVLSSVVGGTAALLVSNRLPPGADGEAQARAALDVAIAGLRSGALHGVTLAPHPHITAKRTARPTRAGSVAKAKS